MTSWMKRRIERSRARCQRALSESKKARRTQAKSETSKHVASSLRTHSHPTTDK
jgi:hypothetical protein